MNAANIILEQLGGNKFIAMTGSSKFTSVDGGNTLFMKLTKNKAKTNTLRITLMPDDTYKMLFSYEKMTPIKKRIFDSSLPSFTTSNQQLFEDVYNDQLKDIFESVTGLYVTFHKRR